MVDKNFRLTLNGQVSKVSAHLFKQAGDCISFYRKGEVIGLVYMAVGDCVFEEVEPETPDICKPAVGQQVRLRDQGDTIYTIKDREEHNGLLFFRLNELSGGLFLESSLVAV